MECERICRFGIHTKAVELMFSEDEYERVKAELPAPVGKRSWYIGLAHGEAVLRRSQYGGAVHWDKKRKLWRIANEITSLVRHGSTEKPFVIQNGRLSIKLPPAHEWPWIRNAGKRLVCMTMGVWRMHLIQELNARAASATAAQVDTPAVPKWVHDMLTPRERLLHIAGEAI